MNNDEEEIGFNTEAQRRELDRMSAELLDKLNYMIAEQEARVQEFSLRQVDAPQPSPTPMQWTRAAETQAAPPQPSPAVSYSTGGKHAEDPAPRKRTVTPPPAKQQQNRQPAKQQQNRQTPTYQAPPPLPHRSTPSAAKGKDKKESSVGCGTIALVIIIISVLMKACD